MSIRPKPKPASPPPTPDVDEFINAGGSTTKAEIERVEQDPDKVEPKPVKLRLPADLLEKIDAAVAKRRPKPSRHQWILEACYQKLERDEGE